MSESSKLSSSIFSANFKSHVIKRVVYFYLHLASLFGKFKYVATVKIRSGNLALNAQNSKKNLPISVLPPKPEYKREVFSIHLHFNKQLIDLVSGVVIQHLFNPPIVKPFRLTYLAKGGGGGGGGCLPPL